MTALAPRTNPISRLNSPARTYRYRRFACALTGADARLAATVGRYSFGVGLSHSHLNAGLSRRTMTRGRRGSLALRRRALPSPPPYRFIPALSHHPGNDRPRPRPAPSPTRPRASPSPSTGPARAASPAPSPCSSPRSTPARRCYPATAGRSPTSSGSPNNCVVTPTDCRRSEHHEIGLPISCFRGDGLLDTTNAWRGD